MCIAYLMNLFDIYVQNMLWEKVKFSCLGICQELSTSALTTTMDMAGKARTPRGRVVVWWVLQPLRFERFEPRGEGIHSARPRRCGLEPECSEISTRSADYRMDLIRPSLSLLNQLLDFELSRLALLCGRRSICLSSSKIHLIHLSLMIRRINTICGVYSSICRNPSTSALSSWFAGFLGHCWNHHEPLTVSSSVIFLDTFEISRHVKGRCCDAPKIPLRWFPSTVCRYLVNAYQTGFGLVVCVLEAWARNKLTKCLMVFVPLCPSLKVQRWQRTEENKVHSARSVVNLFTLQPNMVW